MNDSDRTRTIHTRAPSRGARGLRFTVVAGREAGRVVTVHAPRAVVGRAPVADVTLADPTVSQFHAEFEVAGVEVVVTDLGSRNGTRAGDVRLLKGAVAHGAAVTCGATTLRVELADTGADVRAPGDGEDVAASPVMRGLVGEGPAMRELRGLLARLAGSDLAVLLEGETGTGKEVAARALHDASPRGGGTSPGPFVVLDCTAVPAALAESVLFGHEKGAFTGASERRAGLFEAADGGTLFLDEVGELPRELQPKLLRALERREVVPVGSTRPRAVDVRIVSATWRDLRRLINQGAFREDLYYRLAHARVRVPPLAERREDIPALAAHALARLSPGLRAARALAPEACAALAERAYPGNVRELLATVERAAVLAAGPVVSAADLAFERRLASGASEGRADPAAGDGAGHEDDAALRPFKEAKQTLVDDFERDYLTRLLARAGTNVSRAAALAGIGRASLRELMRRHGLRGED